MTPFDLERHLEDAHWYSPEFLVSLDADGARTVHADEHVTISWAHVHQSLP